MTENTSGLPAIHRQSATRTIKVDSTPAQVGAQDLLALEALRSALCASGIDHDCLDYIAQRCLDGLKVAGLVPVAVNHEAAGPERDAAADLAEYDRVCNTPDWWSYAEFVGEALPYYINRCVAAERKPTFHDIEAVALSANPGLHFSRMDYVYGATTLAQALEVAAAIIATYGGSVEVVRFPPHNRSGGAVGDVRVDTCGIAIPIFFDHEEAPNHA